MILKIILVLILTAFFCISFTDENDSEEKDKALWSTAYDGNFSLTHKLMLTRQIQSLNDIMINQFVMAYVYYRMGRPAEVLSIFKGVDAYLESYLNLDNQ